MKTFFAALFLCLSLGPAWPQDEKPPVRFAIVGLTHDHAKGFLSGRRGWKDVELAGIVEPDEKLVAEYAKRYNLDTNLFHPTIKDLLAKTNVQAVATFTSTFDHKRVVEECAALGIKNVMMEKPLAVNMKHAKAIEAAATKNGMNIIVNYETTWYPGNQAMYALVHNDHAIGDLRKIVVHDGHRGPKEIGCSPAFLGWLTDPVLNGGGALNDFGCYGADLVTWLMDGERPTSVFAVAQHIKPDIYPKVEDEATIIMTYPKTQAILQASWNWPFDRKDMEVYGQTGYVLVPRPSVLRVRKARSEETEMPAPPVTGPDANQVAYLVAVARGEIKPSGLSSLPVNMTVVEILDAAHESVRTGKRVELR